MNKRRINIITEFIERVKRNWITGNILVYFSLEHGLLVVSMRNLLDKSKTIGAVFSGYIKLTFSGRNTFGIFISITFTNKQQIDIRFRSRIKIGFLSRSILRRLLFKKKRLKIARKKNILPNIIRKQFALFGKFRLNTADEYLFFHSMTPIVLPLENYSKG